MNLTRNGVPNRCYLNPDDSVRHSITLNFKRGDYNKLIELTREYNRTAKKQVAPGLFVKLMVMDKINKAPH